MHNAQPTFYASATWKCVASNGEPTRNSSLHYKHGKKDNPYVTTLKIVGKNHLMILLC